MTGCFRRMEEIRAVIDRAYSRFSWRLHLAFRRFSQPIAGLKRDVCQNFAVHIDAGVFQTGNELIVLAHFAGLLRRFERSTAGGNPACGLFYRDKHT